MCDQRKKDCGEDDQLQHLQPNFLACCWPAFIIHGHGPNRRLAALSEEEQMMGVMSSGETQPFKPSLPCRSLIHYTVRAPSSGTSFLLAWSAF